MLDEEVRELGGEARTKECALTRARCNEYFEAFGQERPSLADLAQAALATGYTQLERFAAEYRALFGELPSVSPAER